MKCDELLEKSKGKTSSIEASNEVIRDRQQEILNVKHDLKRTDDEICYFEEQNRKHQTHQGQLTKAFDYETNRNRELTALANEAKLKLQTRESEQRAV